jgi:hypothetical protein
VEIRSIAIRHEGDDSRSRRLRRAAAPRASHAKWYCRFSGHETVARWVAVRVWP